MTSCPRMLRSRRAAEGRATHPRVPAYRRHRGAVELAAGCGARGQRRDRVSSRIIGVAGATSARCSIFTAGSGRAGRRGRVNGAGEYALGLQPARQRARRDNTGETRTRRQPRGRTDPADRPSCTKPGWSGHRTHRRRRRATAACLIADLDGLNCTSTPSYIPEPFQVVHRVGGVVYLRCSAAAAGHPAAPCRWRGYRSPSSLS